MIEPMKKTTIVCLQQDQASALEELRALGVLHVVPQRQFQSEEFSELSRNKEKLESVISALDKMPEAEGECQFPEYEGKTGAELAESASKVIHNITWLEEDIANHDRMYEELLPWGEFSGDLVKQIRDKGIDVRLCVCTEDKMPEFPRNICVEEINRANGKVYFLAVSPDAITVDLPEATLHLETSLSELKERNQNSAKGIAASRGELTKLACYKHMMQDELAEVTSKLDFLAARDGMGAESQLAYIGGYIPANDEPGLKEAAVKHGWAYQLVEVDPEDPEVPTKLKVPKWAKISEPIFDFIGISPGYNENDVSVSVLLFLTLFFGILIGDAGYGFIFLGLGLLAKFKIKSPAAKLPLNLFILLSLATVGWGALSGNTFGLATEKLPGFLQGVEWFQVENNVKWFCFLTAAIHLSLARFWKMIIYYRYPKIVLSNLGWGLFLWGNFFVASHLVAGREQPEFTVPLLAVGAVLVLVFEINWLDIGDVINAPFAFIGSFVDTLSYIRLFAVGLASYNIALSFNGMAADLFNSGGVAVVLGIAVVILGHLLNIVLGFMGVLVHGVRLNTLEFSNHMGITWGGTKFNPFRKN